MGEAMAFEVRPATLDDVSAIVAINELCSPEPEEGDVVWRRRHVESHL